MSYTPISYVNGEAPSLSAGNLNKSEKGIQAAVGFSSKSDVKAFDGYSVVTRINLDGSWWDYKATSTAIEDGGAYAGTVIEPTGGIGRWLRVLHGSVNVRWFGATGDGVTDDHLAIQSAVDALGSEGGSVFLPAGRYKCFPDSLITDRNNPKYWGVIVLPDNVDFFGEGASSVIVGDSSLDGDESQKYADINRNKGIFSFIANRIDASVAQTENVRIRDLSVEGGYNGITIGHVKGVYFDNIYLKDQYLDGVYIGLPEGDDCIAEDIHINNFSIKDCTRTGIAILRGRYIQIANGIIEGITGDTGAAIDIEPVGFGQPSHNIAVSNVISKQCRIGFLIYGGTDESQRVPKHISFDSCHIIEATGASFPITYGQYVTVTGCVITGAEEPSTVSSSVTRGVRVYKSRKLVFSGNTIENGGALFIADDSVISNNVINADGSDEIVTVSGVNEQFEPINISFINNKVIGSQVVVERISKSDVSGNTIAGGSLEIAGTYTSIANNKIYDSPEYGMYIDRAETGLDSAGLTITGNIISNSQEQGIFVKRLFDSTINGNVIIDSNQVGETTGNNINHIYLEYIYRVTINNNSGMNNTGTVVNGIWAASLSNCKYSTMVGNTMSNYTIDPYKLWWDTDNCVEGLNAG